jgi:hypothetical protein
MHTIDGTPLHDTELRRVDASWRAANYLSVGQIYPRDNPLLREPLLPAQVKPRLLGHWGPPRPEPARRAPVPDRRRTQSRGHLRNRPWPRGPGLVANTWLEGTYSEVHPRIPQDATGTTAPYDFTWTFDLSPVSETTTRLVVRERYAYTRWWARFVVEPLTVVSFFMSHRMLRGIRDRAERQAGG